CPQYGVLLSALISLTTHSIRGVIPRYTCSPLSKCTVGGRRATALCFPDSPSSCDHLPGQCLSGVHGNDGTVAVWYHPWRFDKLDDACGWLNIIDASRIVGHEGLQLVQSVVLLEQLYQTRQRDGRREYACRAATALLGGLWVWCRVAPEH